MGAFYFSTMSNEITRLSARIDELETWQAKSQGFLATVSVELDTVNQWLPQIMYMLIKKGVITELEGKQMMRAVATSIQDSLSDD